MLQFNVGTACLFFGLGVVQGMIWRDWIADKLQLRQLKTVKPVKSSRAKK